jgi:hypothetical protein
VPRAEHDPNLVAGLRDHLAAKCRALIDKLSHATVCELYDFSVECDRQRDRLIDIQTGADVLVYRHEIPRDMQPPRADGEMVYTLHDDRLVSAVYDQTDRVESWCR